MWHVLGKFDTEAEGGRMVKEMDFEAEKKIKNQISTMFLWLLAITSLFFSLSVVVSICKTGYSSSLMTLGISLYIEYCTRWSQPVVNHLSAVIGTGIKCQKEVEVQGKSLHHENLYFWQCWLLTEIQIHVGY